MNVLSPTVQQNAEDRLVETGLLTDIELKNFKAKANRLGQPLFGLLLQTGRVSDEELTKILADINKLPYVNLSKAKIEVETLKLLPRDIAEHYMAVPLGEAQSRLVIAMLDASNIQAVDFLSSKVGRPLKVYAASESGIRHVIKQYGDSGLETGIATMLSQNGESKTEILAATQDGKKGQVIVQDSPISKALSAIMDYAAKNQASDIHIEPLEKELRVRVRVDGVLKEIMNLPKSNEPALVSRVKILSNLKIDEHRIPQDGQFSIIVDGHPIDLRIAISPTVWGEQVIMRLLDKTAASLKLEDMGYVGRSLRLLRGGLKQPHGMILTSGPTGSGKTTSMYAMIQEIKSDALNIVTLEDPVEYKIAGVNQIQVNPDIGLTFATGLRSILRQDPDVVMVGEIRDKETAQLAVQAALTGHLVFATLHTNNAAGILPRLLDMGIEPFLIASTVHTVSGQRLVRRNVPGGQLYQSSRPETEAIHQTLGSLLPKTEAEVPTIAADLGYSRLPLANQNAYTLAKGLAGQDNSNGFRGRMGIYEVFQITEAIQDLILKRATSSAIQRTAQAEGMVTIRQDGYLKVLAGLTTLDEVNRVAAEE
ncbi:type II/IV secretion system protein [Candidatus Saccharibacteria bacterium]|nr:type II/IV secretion system protein [Candidatus Saccharibacteria bacterium]